MNAIDDRQKILDAVDANFGAQLATTGDFSDACRCAKPGSAASPSFVELRQGKLLLAMTEISMRLLWPQRRDDRVQPVGQRGGAGLQNQWRFDLYDAVVPDRRNIAPSWPLSDFVGNDFLAAP
jgi:hypothetical protein